MNDNDLCHINNEIKQKLWAIELMAFNKYLRLLALGVQFQLCMNKININLSRM